MSEELQVEQETVVDPVEPGSSENDVDAAPVEAETPEGGEASATPDEPPVKPKKVSRAEKRINELTREKYEAQRQLEAYQAQLAQIQQQQQQPQNPNVEQMPQLADYNYDEAAYGQAVQQWHQTQMQRHQEAQMQQQQAYMQQQEQIKQAQALQAKVSEASNRYPDFVARVNDPSLPPLQQINPAAFQAVMESDAFADVAYYLANNPSEVYRFADLSPIQAVREVTKLEGRFTSSPNTVRTPPKPPSKVSGNSEAVQDPSKMSTEDWMSWRNSQLNSKR